MGGAALLLLLAAPAREAAAHPLHTTLTEVTLDQPRRVVRIVIRVFADDFAKATTLDRRSSPRATDPAPLDYLKRALVLTSGGRTLSLRSCGTRQSGDLLWVCLEAPSPAELREVRMRNALLCDLFADQVNIVRSSLDGATRSILFTRGDPAKLLL